MACRAAIVVFDEKAEALLYSVEFQVVSPARPGSPCQPEIEAYRPYHFRKSGYLHGTRWRYLGAT